jgi:hypothetical protein
LEEITTFDWLKFGHVLGVVAWVGANIVLQVLSLRAMKAGGQRAVDFIADIAWLGTRYFIPIALTVVALGFGLVAELDLDLGEFWISAGLAMFLVSFLTGSAFLGPESGRIAALAAERTPDDPEVQRRISRVIWVARLELLLLILTIFDMIVKPGA